MICFRSYKCKLSNFTPCTLKLEDLIMDSTILGQIIIPGYIHPTTEHPYQMFKVLFYGLVNLAENIRNEALAKELSVSIPTDDRWHRIKWSILFMLTKEKLKQNLDIQEYLSSTGDSYLLEKVNDQTWSIGQDSMGGGNDMGNMWMLHRDNARLGDDNNPENQLTPHICLLEESRHENRYEETTTKPKTLNTTSTMKQKPKLSLKTQHQTTNHCKV